MNFHVGQKVVCVDISGEGDWVPGSALVVGRVYTVAGKAIDNDGFAVLHLEEIKQGLFAQMAYGPNAGYLPWRFRPVKTTSIEVFRQMLAPTPERVNA